jgi:malonate-semialdehyde dehydrogenase (acetylating)/methylmalonate-semialdehyde dehydrogenase
VRSPESRYGPPRVNTIGHWIGGRRVVGAGERRSPVYDPARGVQTGEVALATAEEIDDALRVATAAAREWGTSPLSRRSAEMFRFRELLDAQRDELAAIVTSEHGKVVDDARGEVARGLECVEFACGIPHLLRGVHSAEAATGIDVHTVLQPVGVVAGITPFNFPVMVPLWMLANALACGNAFVLKPSEKDPSASLRLAELVHEAGFPDGVFTVLQGDAVAVDALLTHPAVDALSFVGSTPVARHVYETGTQHGKRVQALGGAKNHMVVVPDADVGAAADAAVSAAYGSAGERCMAISVVVAVGGIADELVDAISARIGEVVVGPGDDERSMMGPLITREHAERVRSYVASAESAGARVAVDGTVTDDAGLAGTGGFFVGCSLVDHVQPGMAVYDDEIFGPVLSVVRVATFDEAIALVNDNPYGNGVALFTRDGGAARQFEREVRVGMVGINVPIPVPVAWHSFGGWKASIFGDAPIYGPEGIRFYTRPKVVTTRWPDPASSAVDLGFPTTR